MSESATCDESYDGGDVAVDVALEKFSELVKKLDGENSVEQDCDVVTQIRDMFKVEAALYNDDHLERLYSSNVDVKVANVIRRYACFNDEQSISILKAGMDFLNNFTTKLDKAYGQSMAVYDATLYTVYDVVTEANDANIISLGLAILDRSTSHELPHVTPTAFVNKCCSVLLSTDLDSTMEMLRFTKDSLSYYDLISPTKYAELLHAMMHALARLEDSSVDLCTGLESVDALLRHTDDFDCVWTDEHASQVLKYVLHDEGKVRSEALSLCQTIMDPNVGRKSSIGTLLVTTYPTLLWLDTDLLFRHLAHLCRYCTPCPIVDIAFTINLLPFTVSKLRHAAKTSCKTDDCVQDYLYVLDAILQQASDDVKRTLFERDRHGLVDALTSLMSAWLQQPMTPKDSEVPPVLQKHPHGHLSDLIRLVFKALSDVLVIVEKDAA